MEMIQLIDNIVRWLDILAWPLLVLLGALFLRRPIKEFLQVLAREIPKRNIDTPWLKLSLEKKDLESKEPVPAPAEHETVHRSLKELQKILVQAQGLSVQKKREEAIAVLKDGNQLFPNNFMVLHNLGVELIRLGIAENRKEHFLEAESACLEAVHLAYGGFPYGTYYNLARAQARAGRVEALKDTFGMLKKINLPENLGKAIADADGDFECDQAVTGLQQYKDLKSHYQEKYKPSAAAQ
ncbi:MAG: hypothetical protein AB1644_04045 [Candidatus Zixiibacteriota bacterium]